MYSSLLCAWYPSKNTSVISFIFKQYVLLSPFTDEQTETQGYKYLIPSI